MIETFGSKDNSSALQAKYNAQKIAFGPMAFQATRTLRNLGILEQSVVEGKPFGLKELGPWETIYEGLTQLPDDIKKS